MLDFFEMANTYDQRKVDLFEGKNLKISTAAVTDSPNPYETAINHIDYNDGEWIIVEEYKTKEEARKGHNKWVLMMTKQELPNMLIDVSSARKHMTKSDEDIEFERNVANE